MTTEFQANQQSLYETDYLKWIETTIEKLKHQDSRSLKPYLEEVFAECYSDAVEQASAETGLPFETCPQSCPYSSAEVLDSQFLPE